MNKFVSLLSVLILGLVFTPAAAAQDYSELVKENENRGEKLRTAFLHEINGQKVVVLRLTPDQLVTGKLREKAKVGRGIVRVVLRPRQIKALNDIMESEGLEKRFTKLEIRVPHDAIAKRGPRSFYVIRPLSVFTDGGDEMDVDDVVAYP